MKTKHRVVVFKTVVKMKKKIGTLFQIKSNERKYIDMVFVTMKKVKV